LDGYGNCYDLLITFVSMDGNKFQTKIIGGENVENFFDRSLLLK